MKLKHLFCALALTATVTILLLNSRAYSPYYLEDNPEVGLYTAGEEPTYYHPAAPPHDDDWYTPWQPPPDDESDYENNYIPWPQPDADGDDDSYTPLYPPDDTYYDYYEYEYYAPTRPGGNQSVDESPASIYTDAELLASIDFHLRILVEALLITAALLFIWFFILKPIVGAIQGF